MTDAKSAAYAALLLRVTMGVLFIAHGLLKVLVFTPAAPLLTPNLQDPMWKAAVEMIGEDRIQELADTVFSYSITALKK